MTFRAQLSIIVGATALALVLVIVLSALIGVEQTRELTAIQGRLLPRLALGPRLEADFDRVGRSMQDAVAAQDTAALTEARALVDGMFHRLASAPAAMSASEAAAIREKVDDYYQAAEELSHRMIAQETGEAMVGAIASMQQKRYAAAEELRQATSVDHRQLSEHFAAIEASGETAAQWRFWISVACLIVVLSLTITFSRRVLGVIKNLSLGFERFGNGNFAIPIPVTTRDELGRLAVEANHMAERLRDTSAELEHSNAELQAFSYSVAHDLRAPLRGMSGFAKVLFDTYGDKLDAEGQDWLQEILLNAEKMGALIDALLSLARLTRSEPRRELVDLSATVRATAAQLAAAEPNRSMELVVEDDLRAEVDPVLIRAVFENLLANAWKFTRKVARGRIEFGATEQNGARVFFVRDNGAGFDMAFAKKLFGAFQRLHAVEEFPGTGIGLATVQRIVHRHGGRVWAEGAVDAGATFYFTFPERGSGATQ